MRRLLVAAGLAALAAPSAAPAAHRDACTVTATPLRGAAPLRVAFTASCASATFTWDFGDGTTEAGPAAAHVYPAGRWQPTLTTDAGVQQLPPVTAVSVTLRGPRQARYAQWITLHVTVKPALPATVRGRRVVAGRIRFRALSPAAYVAFADSIRSQPLHVLLEPKLVLHVPRIATVGQRVRVLATLHPAHAGTVHVVRAVDTHSAGRAQVVVRSTPARGWTAARATTAVTVVQPTLTVGSHGPSVLALEQALAAGHYLLPSRGSTFTPELVDTLYAFQKVNRLPRTGIADAATWRALAHPVAARPRFAEPAFHVEVNKPLQVLYVVRNGEVAQILPVSTAGLPGRFTPVGTFAVYRKVLGNDPSPLGTLFDPSYFTGGYAIHGNPVVPPYPASHGCVRVPMWAAPLVYDELPYGAVVDVY